MGGDITGKMIVPVVDRGRGSTRRTLFGAIARSTGDGLAGLNKFIADAGFYAYPHHARRRWGVPGQPSCGDELFRKLMNETMSRWIELAEDRLAGTGIQCYFAPGNDDPIFVDDILRSPPP